jgi:hypothetical protein
MTFHYLLKPNTFLQRKGLEETKAIFPSLHERIATAMENLQSLLASLPPQLYKEMEAYDPVLGFLCW